MIFKSIKMSWDQKLKTVAVYNKLLDLEASCFTPSSFGQNRQLKVIHQRSICLCIWQILLKTQHTHTPDFLCPEKPDKHIWLKCKSEFPWWPQLPGAWRLWGGLGALLNEASVWCHCAHSSRQRGISWKKRGPREIQNLHSCRSVRTHLGGEQWSFRENPGGFLWGAWKGRQPLCAGSEELLLQLPRPELKFRHTGTQMDRETCTMSGFFPLSLTYTHTPTRLSHINTHTRFNFTPTPTIRFNYTHVDRHTCGQTDTHTQSYSCKLNTHTPLFQTLVFPSLIVGDQPGVTGANRTGAIPCPEQWAHCPGSRESVSCGLALPHGIDIWKKPHLFLPEEPSAVRSVFTGAVTRPFHCTELWVGSAGAARARESTGFEGRWGWGMMRELEEDAETVRWGEGVTQDGPEGRSPQPGAQHCRGYRPPSPRLLASLWPLTSWSKSDTPGTRHTGPGSQREAERLLQEVQIQERSC